MKRFLAYLFLFSIVLLFLGIIVPFQILFYLLFGWMIFLGESMGRVEFNAGLFLLFLIYVAAFFGFVHLLMKGWKHRTKEMDWKFGWSGSIALLILVLFVSGISMIGLTHQLYWMRYKDKNFFRPNNIAARVRSKSLMKIQGNALHDYHANFGSFPNFGFDVKDHPYPASWETKILPFLNRSNLYNTIDFHVPWTDSRNKKTFQTVVPDFIHPIIPEKNRESDNYAVSHYSANALILARSGKSRLGHISDGTSNTILIGEISEKLPAWGQPQNWRDPRIGFQDPAKGFRGPFPGYTSFLFADGTARVITHKIDPEILKAMSTPNGGEEISDY